MSRFSRLLFLLAICSLWSVVAQAADNKPSAKDKCPVCGMFVSRYPDWLASLTFKSGETVYFDGPKDLFSFYLNIPKYKPGKNRADVAALSVKDYYTLKGIDAKRAYFVSGSNVYGPMGKELVAFSTTADARSFLQDHKGEKILPFNDITPAVLEWLR